MRQDPQGDSQGEVEPTLKILNDRAKKLNQAIRADTQQLSQVEQKIQDSQNNPIPARTGISKFFYLIGNKFTQLDKHVSLVRKKTLPNNTYIGQLYGPRGFWQHMLTTVSTLFLENYFFKNKDAVFRCFSDSSNAYIYLQLISIFATLHNKSHSIINIPFDFENRPLKSCITNIIFAFGEAGSSFFLQTLRNKYNNTPIQKTVHSHFRKLPEPIRKISALSAPYAHLVAVRTISKLVYKISVNH